ncbi:MAG: SDR family NAD(P)-dependent oxidoreductase [Bacteroidales bacterium]|jgi:short-subunit dehydrogenase|nr:SDR family NAD(P)-dependent oxidoreductase [Bacteroidales bacterium]
MRNTALITGASSGIGLEYARCLSARGYNLIIVSNEEKITAAGNMLAQEFNVDVRSLCMDLATPTAAYELFDFCSGNSCGTISVLINNAGILSTKDVVETDPKRIETMMYLHVFTPTLLCRLFAEQMRSQNGNCYILNMSSMAAWMPVPYIVLYSATKMYLLNFSRALHKELYNTNVSITVVCPGAVATPFYGFSENSKYMKIGLALGIIMPASALARKALNKMFRRRKTYIPAFINYFFIALMKAAPDFIIRAVHRKIKRVFL